MKVLGAEQWLFYGDKDCGDTLKRPEGVSLLRKAMEPIDVYSWDYEIWCGSG